ANNVNQEIEKIVVPYSSGNVTTLQRPASVLFSVKPCANGELQNEELASFREQDR
ncbi:hypothetical protein U1Q18_012099, partial [Sarracenia purpurea var. burkii]